MITHHSHSGQFCQHARNSLEEMVLRAIDLKFDLICLTEHMPRLYAKHIYPEELETQTTLQDLSDTFDKYLDEARRLQAKYGNQIDILVGFEGEGIDDEYVAKCKELARGVDLVVGSLHHSGDVPIDFDLEMWEKDLLPTQSMPEIVYKYFERLQSVLQQLKPAVVAHYDLVRLFFPQTDVKNTPVWPLITQTIDTAIENDCMFELNSSAIRKGWSTPYPQRDIAAYIVAKGGKLCLSDDAHNVDQLGLNYARVFEYVQSLGVDELWRLKKVNGTVEKVPMSVTKLENWLENSDL